MREEDLDRSRVFTQFVVPPVEDIHKKYSYRKEEIKNGEGHWSYNKVIIERHNPDGSVDDVFEYQRNYSSFYKTFEPFRQLNNGVWKEYALISETYTRFSVVDLELGEIVAVEPYPTITEEHHARWRKAGYEQWCEKDPVGTEKPGWGFCPVEFHVPDFWDEYSENSLYYVMKSKEETGGETEYLYDEKSFMRTTGQFALYMGCVWGDDSGGWKIRYIDLSRLNEGIVTSDERFGYIEFAGKSLKEVAYYPDSDQLVLPVQMYVTASTGKAEQIDANWAKDSD